MSVELLSIDVTRELETLSEAQLRGTWQVPAELVRVALRRGADAVSVRRRRGCFEVRWTGPPFDESALTDLLSAVDPLHPPHSRQRAIAALEGAGVEELLWASAVPGAHLRITGRDGAGRYLFRHRHRGRPRLDRERSIEEVSGIEIEWRCSRLDWRRALKWLALALRFCDAEVTVNGSPLPQGFSDGLYHLRLEHPVPCRVGLTRAGDEPALWLLRDGVVSTRASVAGYPPFEAAVELREHVAPGASGADLRQAVTPFVSELVDRAVWMMVEVAGQLDEMEPGARERIVLLLLRAARRRLRAREIGRIPLVMDATGRRVSVDEVEALAARRGGLLAALDPAAVGRETLVDPRSAVVAPSEVRGLLSELTDVRFQAPPRRVRGVRRRFVDGVRSAINAAQRRVRGMITRHEVAPNGLKSQETKLLEAARAALAPLEVTLCEGRRPAGRSRHGVILSRADPVVAVAADLVGADTTWLYAALLALDTGTEPPYDLRRRWLAALGVDLRLI